MPILIILIFLLIFMALLTLLISVKIHGSVEEAFDTDNKTKKWYVDQNYCEKYCDSKYPVPSQVNYHDKEPTIEDLQKYNKKMAQHDYCFKICQHNLFMNFFTV